jgi:two-component system CheB/CheR fusion protein
VLVVEDNPDIAHSMVALLRYLGHDVQLADNGSEAISIARRFSPQIAFMDIGLPGMNGLELAAAFRSDELLRSVFLVALTGFGQAEDRRRSFAAGFDEHLVKPLSYERLRTTLQSVASQRSRAANGSEDGSANQETGNQQNNEQNQEQTENEFCNTDESPRDSAEAECPGD